MPELSSATSPRENTKCIFRSARQREKEKPQKGAEAGGMLCKPRFSNTRICFLWSGSGRGKSQLQTKLPQDLNTKGKAVEGGRGAGGDLGLCPIPGEVPGARGCAGIRGCRWMRPRHRRSQGRSLACRGLCCLARVENPSVAVPRIRAAIPRAGSSIPSATPATPVARPTIPRSRPSIPMMRSSTSSVAISILSVTTPIPRVKLAILRARPAFPKVTASIPNVRPVPQRHTCHP